MTPSEMKLIEQLTELVASTNAMSAELKITKEWNESLRKQNNELIQLLAKNRQQPLE